MNEQFSKSNLNSDGKINKLDGQTKRIQKHLRIMDYELMALLGEDFGKNMEDLLKNVHDIVQESQQLLEESRAQIAANKFDNFADKEYWQKLYNDQKRLTIGIVNINL